MVAFILSDRNHYLAGKSIVICVLLFEFSSRDWFLIWCKTEKLPEKRRRNKISKTILLMCGETRNLNRYQIPRATGIKHTKTAYYTYNYYHRKIFFAKNYSNNIWTEQIRFSYMWMLDIDAFVFCVYLCMAQFTIHIWLFGIDCYGLQLPLQLQLLLLLLDVWLSKYKHWLNEQWTRACLHFNYNCVWFSLIRFDRILVG